MDTTKEISTILQKELAKYINTIFKVEDLTPKSEEKTKFLQKWLQLYKGGKKEEIYRFFEEFARTFDSYGASAYMLRTLLFSRTVSENPKLMQTESEATLPPKDSTPLHVQNGWRNGLEVWYYSDKKEQKQFEWFWVNGQIEGEERGWYKNGKLAYRRHRKGGILDGEEKRWHENGQLSFHFVWKKQQLIGEDKSWYSSGKVAYIRTYAEGMKLEGIEKRWHETGNLSLEKSWKDGVEHGIENKYDEDGKLKIERVWENGTKVQEKVHES